EEDFLLLDVADGTVPGLGVFLVNREAHRDLEGRGIRNAALLALVHVILQLQANRVAALVAEVGRIGVVRSALAAQHVARMKRIGNYGRTAILTSRAQVVQTLEVTTFALPVTNGVIHKLQL